MWTKQLRGIRSRPENQWSSEEKSSEEKSSEEKSSEEKSSEEKSSGEKSSPRRVRETLSILLGSNTLMFTLS